MAPSSGLVEKNFRSAWQVFGQPPVWLWCRRLTPKVLPAVTHREWEATKMGRVMDILGPPDLFGISISHLTPAFTTRPIRIYPLRNSGRRLNSKRRGTC